MFIELLDNRDKDLLVESILRSIRELAELREKSAGWGCGTMSIQDKIDRLQRLLRDVSNAD